MSLSNCRIPDYVKRKGCFFLFFILPAGWDKYALPQTSYLKFKRDQLVIHDNGYYENPLSFYMEGYLEWSEKIAELMPLEYQPTEK